MRVERQSTVKSNLHFFATTADCYGIGGVQNMQCKWDRQFCWSISNDRRINTKRRCSMHLSVASWAAVAAVAAAADAKPVQ